MPGGAFHITSRLQGHVPLFVPICDRIVELIDYCFARSDATLVARAIMPNHLHLVMRQGSDPLHATMQPLLRRIAYLVQRTHGVKGHVFERAFAHRTCGNAAYLRNCIVYAHLNPVRAKLADRPEDYHWTSHLNYVADDPAIEPPTPVIWAGDLYWQAEVGGAQHEPPEARDRQRICDLRDFVEMLLRVHHVDLKVEYIRGDYRSAAIVRIRRRIIERALDAGFRGHEIARFLNISPGAVSTVKRQLLSQAAEAFALRKGR